jgi:hypothetical protein
VERTVVVKKADEDEKMRRQSDRVEEKRQRETVLAKGDRPSLKDRDHVHEMDRRQVRGRGRYGSEQASVDVEASRNARVEGGADLRAAGR